MKKWATRVLAGVGTVGVIVVLWLTVMQFQYNPGIALTPLFSSIPFILLIIFSLWKWNSDEEAAPEKPLGIEVSGGVWAVFMGLIFLVLSFFSLFLNLSSCTGGVCNTSFISRVISNITILLIWPIYFLQRPILFFLFGIVLSVLQVFLFGMIVGWIVKKVAERKLAY